MRVVAWMDGPPPEGFELGEVPEDFGVGRAAYRWRDPQPGETSTFSHGRMLDMTLHRGERLFVRDDGTIALKLGIDGAITKPGHQRPSNKELIDFLLQAAREGVTGP